ncbi:tyrosine-type recombinase/integrase [Bordetella bronchiseptica]|uniref:tyrosine-type recombinase/integrase n=1 Tax=Bordetella bronchiseptica TaxID=518 RepID=UPI00045B1ABE|nr:site-specific integrase [Bordetella bronchiseptica]KAK53408.1 site-specific recombinase, phage integrase family [Bordetella bronchiseptica OSU054]
MGTFRKRGDTWRAEINKAGVRESKTFPTKREAQEWAAARETELATTAVGGITPKTVAQVLQRYCDEISPRNKGHRWERVRIKRFLKEEADLCAKLIHTVATTDLGAWRDRRLAQVQPVSVRRDIALLRAAWGYARREWRNLKDDPWLDMTMPPEGRHRERIYTQDEVDSLVSALGWEEGQKVVTARQQTAACFLLSLETAMRSGELLSLEHSQVDLKKRVAQLDQTKNGDRRAVPLSSRAVVLFKSLAGLDEDKVFTITPALRDVYFRQGKAIAEVDGATFHDARATALTRLSKKLSILELARMVGHRDPRSLMIYYRESAADIAKKLD